MIALRLIALCVSVLCFGAAGQPAATVAGNASADPPIAFASQRDGNWEIYVMDAARQSRRLTHRDVEDRFPLWSHDGAQLAFGSQVGGDWGWELWVMDASGTRQRRLHSGIVAKSTRGWCRDDTRIVFAATAGGNVDVYTVDVASTRVTRLSSANGEDRDPSWSPDCRHVAFPRRATGMPRFTSCRPMAPARVA